MVTKDVESVGGFMGETKSKEVTKPDFLADEQDKELRNRADQVIEELKKAEGTAILDIEERISNVGVQDQKSTSSSLALLQERMGQVFYSDNKESVSSNLTKDIANLQGALSKLNPRDIQRETKYQILKLIPFFGNWIVKVLKESSERRLTLQEFIDHLEESLQHGELMLRQDNAQLKVMYGDLEGRQKLVSTDAYLAELLLDRLTNLVAETPDEDRKKNNYNKILFRVSIRAQDLRAMENA